MDQKPKTSTLLEKNRPKIILTLVKQWFLRLFLPKAQISTYALMNTYEITHRMGKMFANQIYDKGLLSRTYKEFLKINNKKKKITQF